MRSRTPPTAEIDKAIRWAKDDLDAARTAHLLRPTTHTERNIEIYEEALNRLLDQRGEYR